MLSLKIQMGNSKVADLNPILPPIYVEQKSGLTKKKMMKDMRNEVLRDRRSTVFNRRGRLEGLPRPGIPTHRAIEGRIAEA